MTAAAYRRKVGTLGDGNPRRVCRAREVRSSREPDQGREKQSHPHLFLLCRGRIDTPASIVGIGQIKWAGSAARIQRHVERSVLVVFGDNSSRTIRLQPLQIDRE